MPRLEIFQVDAFTRHAFTGNPAGVVLGADGLDDATLLAIARELNNGDSAFAFPPDSDDHDLRVRFFTPRTEAAFVGHATLALHTVLALRDGRRTRRQKGRTGIVTVAPHASSAHEIRLPRAPLGRVIEATERDAVFAALGLDAAKVDDRCPVQIVGASSTRLLIGVANGDVLGTLAPQMAALTELSARIGAAGYFVFSLAPAVPGRDVESRMFCPAIGIAEDPVSGNAHGMLVNYLSALDLLPAPLLRAAQGRFLQRPGELELELQSDGAVALRGEAHVVFRTTIDV